MITIYLAFIIINTYVLVCFFSSQNGKESNNNISTPTYKIEINSTQTYFS